MTGIHFHPLPVLESPRKTQLRDFLYVLNKRLVSIFQIYWNRLLQKIDIFPAFLLIFCIKFDETRDLKLISEASVLSYKGF